MRVHTAQVMVVAKPLMACCCSFVSPAPLGSPVGMMPAGPPSRPNHRSSSPQSETPAAMVRASGKAAVGARASRMPG